MTSYIVKLDYNEFGYDEQILKGQIGKLST